MDGTGMAKAAAAAILSIIAGGGFLFGTSWLIGYVHHAYGPDGSDIDLVQDYVPWLAGAYGTCLACSLALVGCLRKWRRI